MDAADVEVLLEAIGLKEIGKLESAHIAPLLADLFLEIEDDLLDVLPGEAATEEFEPETLAVEAKGELLASE